VNKKKFFFFNVKKKIYCHRPVDIESNTVTTLPSSSLSVQSQQTLPISRIASTHTLLKPIRHLPIPIKSQLSLPLSTFSPSQMTITSLKPQIHLPYDHSYLSAVPISSISSSSLINWSVTDVGQFIEKHFPEKNLAQVNSFSFFFFFLMINLFDRNLFNKKSMDIHYPY